ncbi:MARVEL domain-containing protein, partial [Trichostrongylus colubriformis]
MFITALMFLSHQQFQDPFSGFTAQPINAAYYMPGAYNGGYSHEPYGQNAYIDAPYVDTQQFPYYGGYTYTPYYADGQAYRNYAYQSSQAYPGAYGPYPGASGAYRPYPQPQPSPPRRSRTAPGRAVPLTVRTTAASSRKSRGVSVDQYDKRQYKAVSGPMKKPSPAYRKTRDPYTYRLPQYQETDFGGAPYDYSSQFHRPYTNEAPTTLRRLRPFYAPSYTTYPPSTMFRTDKKLDTKRYPLFARIAVKVAQLILAAAILGLVLGPMRGSSFHDFVIRTSTEWQGNVKLHIETACKKKFNKYNSETKNHEANGLHCGYHIPFHYFPGAVVGIVSTWGIFTAVLLMTSFLANSVHMWRKVDAHVNLIAILAYLLASCLEAYYAACYPP